MIPLATPHTPKTQTGTTPTVESPQTSTHLQPTCRFPRAHICNPPADFFVHTSANHLIFDILMSRNLHRSCWTFRMANLVKCGTSLLVQHGCPEYVFVNRTLAVGKLEKYFFVELNYIEGYKINGGWVEKVNTIYALLCNPRSPVTSQYLVIVYLDFHETR